MFRKAIVAIAMLALGLAAPLAQQAPVQPSPVKRTVLQRTDVPSTNLELIYATIEIAAGFKAGRHSHPGVVMAQVMEGAIHNEGATDRAVKRYAVYILEKGKPLASPVR
jgi:hypothetical protein